jgi:probable rRNA maturation factor
MSQLTLPMTEVLVVADCWQNEPNADAVIQRAIAAAAEAVDADVGEAELAVMLTDDSGIGKRPQAGRRTAHARRHRDRL